MVVLLAMEVTMARVVGFISEKGGVGKTTACYHIAVALARFHNQRVLVLDADYQRGGISGRFFPEVIESFSAGSVDGTTLFHKYQQLYSAGEQSPTVDIRPYVANLDVMIADPRLSNVTVDKLPSTNNIKDNNLLLLRHLKIIDFVLSSVASRYDWILIDSHPEVSDVLRSIIYASDCCVSPVKLDRQSSIGVATIVGEINNVNADVEMIHSSLKLESPPHETTFVGSIGMMAREWDERLKQSEQWEYNRLRHAGGVFENYVTEGDGLRQAAAQRVPVYDIAIANAYKQSQQFRDLTIEFMENVPMTADVRLLVEWLGPTGAIAGLEGSDLTIADMREIAEKCGVTVGRQKKRSEIVRRIVASLSKRIDKSVEDLMKMSYDELRRYFSETHPSREELLEILLNLDIRPGSEGKRNLLEFAAREISDIGMFARVAQGSAHSRA
jgi:chromosome partitioning protein